MKRFLKRLLLAIAVIAAVFAVFLMLTRDDKGLKDKASLIEELESRSYRLKEVKQAAEDKQAFGVPRQSIVTDKAVFTVYEFNSEEEAKLNASYISPGGSSIKTPNMSWYITWANHPHYYQSGKMIVLYVGRDAKVLYDLRIIMGKQNAGAKWYEILLSRRGK
ncbi:MAG: hypothetical protein K0R84_1674 [Clostridia bacterium]|jgi:hypothetical protein|nr:hypothetical protein [Clostridia bacterium]